MKGFIRVLQWYCDAKHISYFDTPEKMTGDASSINSILGYHRPVIHQTRPSCPIGHIVFQIEDDGSLKLVDTNYDTSG